MARGSDSEQPQIYTQKDVNELRHKLVSSPSQLPSSRRSAIVRLAGILRLANAFDLSHDRKVRRLHVGRHDGAVIVRGEGYDEVGPTAEHLAAARYLLEVNCHMPILVRSWPPVHK